MLRLKAATVALTKATGHVEPVVQPLVFARTASRLSRRRRIPPSPPPRHDPARPPSHVSEAGVPATARTATREGAAPADAALTEVPSISRIPVEVPHDADGVLDRASGPWKERLQTLLSVPALVVARQLEPLNIFIGWEEANRYALHSPDGALLGYLLEEESSIVSTMSRQMLRTHRPFRATVISPEGDVLLRIHRPFSWINSRIFVSTPSSSASTAQQAKEEMKCIEAPAPAPSSSSTALTARAPDPEPALHDDGEIIGECQQEWAFMRRRYNAFVKRGDGFDQFGRIDSGFLAWDFTVRDEAGQVVGSINRNFAGFGRELFTDTGQYVLRFEGVVDELNPQLAAPSTSGFLPSPGSQGGASTALTPSMSSASSPQPSPDAQEPAEAAPSLPLDHRAVLLASAVSIDFDYFTRHRGGLLGGGGMFFPMPIPMGGSGGAAGEAGEAGAGAEAGRVQGEADGPLPPTEYDDAAGAGGLRNRPEGVPRGEDGVVPGGGAGQGWGVGQDGIGAEEEVMQDPWASDEGQDEGTWTWGDLFDQDSGDLGGGDGDW